MAVSVIPYLLRQRTREGMAIARQNGKLKGRKPKLTGYQQRQLGKLHAEGEHTISDLAGMFGVSRPAVYRALDRENAKQARLTNAGDRTAVRNASSHAVDKALDLGELGALGGTRTPSLLIRSQMLYPLSYERRLNLR